MSTPTRMPSRLPLRCLTTAAALLAAAVPLRAGDLLGLDPSTNTVYEVDSASGSLSPKGQITGGPAGGFVDFDARADGKLFAVANGPQFGYEIWEIDDNTLVATKLLTIGVPNSARYIAADPAGTHVWVMGNVTLSLGMSLHRIALANGLPKSIGTTFATITGLGFDTAGDLFSVVDEGSGPVLLKIDKTNINNSTQVGTGLAGVDASLGVDFASDAGSGSLHLYSRNAQDLHAIDTSVGVAILLSTIGSGIDVIAESECKSGSGHVLTYGAGCAGSGGFVPELAWTGCPVTGAQVELSISNGLGGANAVLLFGFGQASLPVGSGCSLLLNPIVAATALPLGGAGPGNGSIAIPGTLPASAGGLTVTLQAWVIDPAVGIGGAASNGLEVSVAP